MRNLVFLFFIILAVSITSCRKDFSTIPSFGQLEFSRDTVFLDTIFTNIGSATYNLRVYNRSNDDITIPNIALERGTTSNYRLNVDGIPGKDFQNIDILAKDSIFIFVETTIDVTTVPDPLYTDRILFDTGTNQQDVDLVTLVQDANFIFPGRDPVSMEIETVTLDGTMIQGRFLEDSELTFTNARPTVIYGFAAVPANKTLTIEAGARVHFHNNSALIIESDATLKVNGTLNEKVVFEGDRLENAFSKIPGQWSAIWLRNGSKENEINHAKIKNAVVGLLVDSDGSTTDPTLTLKNTELYNHASFGVLGRQSNIIGENVVIGNAGQSSFACIAGSYDFTHSTFANYFFGTNTSSVSISNFLEFTDENGQEVIATGDLIAANFTNCIIDGANNFDFFAAKNDGAVFNMNITNSMIRFSDVGDDHSDNPLLDFTDMTFYQNIILNGVPNFRDAFNGDFIIGQDSEAINLGNATGASQVPMDILGVVRTMNPDAGAYQHIIF